MISLRISMAAALLVAGLSNGFAQAPPPPAAEPVQSGGFARHLNDAFVQVFEKVAPSVVVIEVKRDRSEEISQMPRGLRFFFRSPDGSEYSEPPSEGSGIIFREDGYILTNCHVVEDAGKDSITVRLRDGRELPAKVVGLDEKTDIAVIKVDATGLPAAQLGDSDSVKVGQFAFAIGAPFELPYTFTVGVVSGKERGELTASTMYEDYIQTDASINPGNSGGPLCDIDGRVVGINALINGLNRGLGFAIPINLARDVAEQLIASGRVVRSWLGIQIESLENRPDFQRATPEMTRGVLVREAIAGTPASKSGLRQGDVIVKADGRPVGRAYDLQKVVFPKKVGDEVDLEVWRAGRTLQIKVRTAEQQQPKRTAAAQPSPPAKTLPDVPPSPSQSLLGVTVQDISPEVASNLGLQRTDGVVVTGVDPGSPADVAGIQPADVLFRVGDDLVADSKGFADLLTRVHPEKGAVVLIDRLGDKTFVILKPE